MFQRHPVQNQELMFITTNIKNRQPLFGNPGYARLAVDMMYWTQERYPFLLFAFVIMPDHCHFLVNVPKDGSISKIMYTYKRAVVFSLGKGPIWQSRFHLTFPKNASAVINYIHQNPVKKGLCSLSSDYAFSSASGKWDIAELDVF